MLPLNMELEHVFLEEFSAFVALIFSLGTILKMDIHIALLDSLSAAIGAVSLKIIDEFL